MTDLADRPDLAGYELDDRFRLRGRAGLPVGRPGAGPAARRPAAHRPPPRPDDRRVRVRATRARRSARSRRRRRPPRRRCPTCRSSSGPALNEELAATAVMGSQLVDSLDDKRYDGVVGVWYGKAPGLDRAGDAIRHGVFAGTSRHGGVMAIVGDDPAAKSSTLPSSSDATLVDLHMPILFPGDVQEALDLSRHAVALSRASGIWVGLKLVTPVADGTGTVDVHPDRVQPVTPTMEFDGKLFVPHPSGRLLTPYTLEMEREFQQVRSELARRYGVANQPQPGDGVDRAGLDRHRRQRPHLPRAARGARPARPRRRRRPARRRHPPVPPPDAGARRRAADPRLRPRPRRGARHRGEEPDARAAREERDVRLRRAPTGRRSPRRDAARLLVPGTGMLDADRLLEPLRRRLAARLGDDACVRCPPSRRAVADPADGQPHAVLLQRLPAQPLDAGARGHARRRRHRLPRDGRPDGARARRRHRRADGDGQRGRAVDRHGAVRRARPPRAEPRRRHVLPLRLAGHPRRRRRRRRHHLQAALQRHGRDDRRPGPAGPDDRARGRPVAAAGGRQPGHRHVRRPGQVGRRRLRRRSPTAGSRCATGPG